jgi:hypothetical protein
MFTIHIDKRELWDEEKEEFYYIPECDLTLEHSLLSVSKWESKYHKSFIDTPDKSVEETVDYIKMMVVGDMPEDENVFYAISKEQLVEIGKYINDPMTATVINAEDEKEIESESKGGKFTTSEEIYSWMCLQNIPFECQMWHLNRLIILIKLCAIANKPKDNKKKKMTTSDLALRRARMEAARAKYSKH